MAQRELSPSTETTQRQSVVRSEAQIRLLFEKFQAFVDEYRPKISLGGVFIATSQPKPVGTTIACEFRLADGFRLCQALGDVLWTRPQATAPDRPAGMGIRFNAIDDEGRKLILKILEEQVKTGGAPFEVEHVPADAQGAGGSRVPEPGDDPASTHRRSAPVPMPREDPASTFSRPAVPPGPPPAGAAQPPPGLAPIEPADGVPAFDAEAPFDAVQPLADFVVEPVASEEPADFNAPWGVELPGIPEDVIEPDEEAMTSIDDDFSSDPKGVEFGAADDGDLFDFDAPGADEGPELFGLPDFEVIEEEPVADSADGARQDPLPTPPTREGLFATPEFPDVDEPLGPETEPGPDLAGLNAPGPSLAGLDDTLPRSLPDDGGELGMHRPAAAAASEAAAASPALGPFESTPALPDIDEPLTPEEGEMPGPASAGLERPDLSSGLGDDLATGPVSDFGLGPEFADIDSGDDSWWDSDADDEWEDDAAESGLKSFWRDFRITVSESKGRILAIAALLVIVGAGLVFRERVLALVGLGSQDVPSPPPPAAGTVVPAEGEEDRPEEADGAEEPAVESLGGDGSSDPAESRTASDPDGVGGSLETDSPPTTRTEPPPPAPARRPPPSAETPSSLAPAAAAARTVRSIDCEQTPQGTNCVVAFDGQFAPDRFEHHSLGYDPLKEQIVILGIEAPYHSQRIDVGTLELDRIRTGLDADRLKLVFDLSSERMTLSSFEPRAGRLEILVSRKR